VSEPSRGRAARGDYRCAERLAREAEEARLREEELQRQREEAERLRLEDIRKREAEAARRADELSRLQTEYEDDVVAEDQAKLRASQMRAGKRAADEWAAFMGAPELPDPSSEAAIYTFLSELDDQDSAELSVGEARDPKALLTAIVSRVGLAERVARTLEDEAEIAADMGDTHREHSIRAFAQKLRDDSSARLDRATAVVMQAKGLWSRENRDMEELAAHLSSGQGIAMALWANLSGRKAMRAGKMDVQDLGLRVAVSRAVCTQQTDGQASVVRVIMTPFNNAERVTQSAVEFVASTGLGEVCGAQEAADASKNEPRPQSAIVHHTEEDDVTEEAAEPTEESKEQDDAPASAAAAAEGDAPPADGEAAASEAQPQAEPSPEAQPEAEAAAAPAATAEEEEAPLPADEAPRVRAADDTAPFPGDPGTVEASHPPPRERKDFGDAGMEVWEPVSGVISVQLVKLPEASSTVKRCQIIRDTPLTTSNVHLVLHPMQGGGMSQALTVTGALPPHVIVPDDFQVRYWHHSSKQWQAEEDAPPAELPEDVRAIHFKTTFMTHLALVQPRTVDLPFRQWSLRPLPDLLGCIQWARQAVMDAGMVCPTVESVSKMVSLGGVSVGRPFVSEGSSAVVAGRSTSTSTAPLGEAPLSPSDLLPLGGWDDVTSGEDPAWLGPLPDSSRRMPLPEAGTLGVLFTVVTSRLRLDIAVGDDSAWLVGPIRPELSCLIGVGMHPGVLVNRLRGCGFRITPDTADADLPALSDAVGPKRPLTPKEAVLEKACARSLARLGTGAVVAPSVWNQRCSDPEFFAVLRFREEGDAASDVSPVGALDRDAEAHPTSWRTIVGATDTDSPTGVRWWLTKTQEGQPAFSPAVAPGADTHNLALRAAATRLSASCVAQCSGASALTVEAAAVLLMRTRVVSFTA
jgi:hypothetical protein